MNTNTIMAGTICGLIIRVFAIIGAVAISRSWWVAIIAVVVFGLIESEGRYEVLKWRKH